MQDKTRALGNTLVLQQTQASLHDHILKHRSRRDIDGLAFGGHNDHGALQGNTTTQVDLSSDCEMVELNDLGNVRDARQEAGDLLEVASKLDERSWAETVGGRS